MIPPLPEGQSVPEGRKMGPIEASMREQAIAARRRLMRGTPKQVLAISQIVRPFSPSPIPVAVEAPEPWPDQPRPAPYDIWVLPNEPSPIRVPVKASSVIIREVAAKHGLSPAQITGQSRERKVTNARHEAAFRIVFELGYSYPKTGRVLGNRDHTTVLNSLRRHAATSPDAADIWQRHVEVIEAMREAKHAPALKLYFDAGMSVGQIAGLIRCSTKTVAMWIGAEKAARFAAMGKAA